MFNMFFYPPPAGLLGGSGNFTGNPTELDIYNLSAGIGIQGILKLF